MNDSLLGQTLAGRFRVLELLGEGAMGRVYLAEHVVMARRVALKVLKRALAGNRNIVERFRREARAASRLEHPNIVYVVDCGRTDDGRFYLTMQYIPGESLRDTLQDLGGRVLPLPRALELLAQTASALAAAHDAGVIHRDIKPENLLLGRSRAGGDLIKVLDFGLAKIVAGTEYERTLTARGEVYGTPAYMSPEQAAGEDVDTRTDVYSFGILAYELLTGDVPFSGKTLAQILAAHALRAPPPIADRRPPATKPLPDGLPAIVMSCLAKHPDDRATRMTDVLRVIRAGQESLKEQQHQYRSYPSVASFADSASVREVWSIPPSSETDEEVTDPGSAFSARRTAYSARGASSKLEREAPREWIWAQVCKFAQNLADALRDRRLGSVALLSALTELSRVEEQVLGLETQIALLESRLDDLGRSTREREARLRYACVDLSIERGRLMDEAADKAVIRDLGYQIAELESRLRELADEQAQQEAKVTQEQQTLRKQLSDVAQALYDRQRVLLGLLRDVRRHVEDPALTAAYDNIDKFLDVLARRSTVLAD